MLDLGPIRELLGLIIERWRPERIWLFGSRARGEARDFSDWDVFAVVPDDLPDEELGPEVAWRLRHDTSSRADVVLCHVSDYQASRDTPNTLAYAVEREGVLLYER